MTMDMRPIPGYEGHYSVSSAGQVWSHKRERWLSQTISRPGYRLVTLCKPGSQRKVTVHRLVAMAWVDNPAPSINRIINHINGDKLNNSCGNLEWCTYSHNTKHAFAHGLMASTSADQLAHASEMGRSTRRLSAAQVLSARQRVKAGEKQIRIAEELGISRGNLSQIINGRIYIAA